MMADTLTGKTCTPCKGGIPPLTQEEAARLHSQVPGWELREDAKRIERQFKFRNFGEALHFVQRVGALAEAEAHHPDISFGWGYATVSLQTKKIKGLHENDFILAAKVDQFLDRAAISKKEIGGLRLMRGLVHHVVLTVSDLAKAFPLYDGVLTALGYRLERRKE